MKLFAIICTLLVASQVQATVGNVLDDLVKQALEVVRLHMLVQDPLPIPPGPPLVFNDPESQTDLTLQISQATVSKASNFFVNKISHNLLSLHSEFCISFPTIHLQGDFYISGTGIGRAVYGQGNIMVDITNLVINGEFQMKTVSGGTLQVESNSVSYTFQDFKVTQTGLKIEGMTDQQVQEYFPQIMSKLLQEPEVSQKIAQKVKYIANRSLKNRPLNDLIMTLRNFDDAGAHCSDLLKAELRFHSINSTSPEILSSRIITNLSKLLKERKFFWN